MLPVKRSSRASHGCQRSEMAAQDQGAAVGSLGMTWRWKIAKVAVCLVSSFSVCSFRAPTRARYIRRAVCTEGAMQCDCSDQGALVVDDARP